MNAATDIALNEENTNRVIEAIRGLIESHVNQINAAIRDNEERKITLGLAVCIVHNEPAPAIDVKIRFVPQTIKDEMSLVCVDPNQVQFKFENEDQAAPEQNTEPDEPPRVVAETVKRGRKSKVVAVEGGEA